MKTISQELYKKAKKIIPGGTQLLSKRPEIYLPELWPAYFEKAKGVEIWDLDGNKYVDMTNMSVGACTLGYSDEDVDNAVINSIKKGTMSTLNCPEEVELAELLLKIHPWAESVRFARTGGEIAAIAIRIARAYSKKDKIAFCGYHGWHDWYLASNLSKDSNLDGHLLPGLKPTGVPRSLIESAIPFEFNKIEQLEKIVEKNDDIGVIILEPMRHDKPENGFLEKIRDISTKINAVLIFDEISIGWRINVGGVHSKFGVNPDIAIFAKAMGNGYPIAAVIGNRKVMNATQDTFISSTYWTGRVGPTAAIATIKKMQNLNVPAHLDKIGKLIGEGWQKIARKNEIDITIHKPNCLISFTFEYPNTKELMTLFIQEMLKRNYLAGTCVYVSYAHTEQVVSAYLKVIDEVFGILSTAIKNGNILKLIEGPLKHDGFQRLVS
ncbi:aminotransferase class III-fold pyridoxal phosphate-dependent enzyme [Promethearchaeum syntrophicum]|uniref:Aminotransferase class III-fold pyridoxal phosphate-dependent enzyme n=1 Tax=Promethearchaeum syntrophicum TaxID=2594042 RepID=A0A5B9DBA1_9ARCH|nr:aminotransferase class III-fold pyridoxal phosphate-dependent enzyme [Candidatus Prometheoarchaeum syntrophicum]QEE16030.1 Glutamate-1-semialdehyde 2,1-aminomutase [Candidatus Prometheoarchaeum syntrophicum]